MFVAGVDGCRAGWVRFAVEVPSLATSVDVVDLAELLRNRPSDLACIGIDIPIGLIDGSRACDKAARKLLGQPRGSSVFAAPCRRLCRQQLTPPRVTSIATRRAEDSASRRLGSSPRSNRWTMQSHQSVKVGLSRFTQKFVSGRSTSGDR